jgi:hypothetical protein
MKLSLTTLILMISVMNDIDQQSSELKVFAFFMKKQEVEGEKKFSEGEKKFSEQLYEHI